MLAPLPYALLRATDATPLMFAFSLIRYAISLRLTPFFRHADYATPRCLRPLTPLRAFARHFSIRFRYAATIFRYELTRFLFRRHTLDFRYDIFAAVSLILPLSLMIAIIFAKITIDTTHAAAARHYR